MLTALGGLVLASYPTYLVLKILYGYWGFTTVLLFWGAMIKATRIWGGAIHQGKAFGFLEGGRGLVASLMGTAGVFLFTLFSVEEEHLQTLVTQQEAFRYVILFCVVIVGAAGVVVFAFLENPKYAITEQQSVSKTLTNFKILLKQESVWLLTLIIMCAYFGYKVTDIYSLFAFNVMGYDEAEAANISALQLYLRPIVAISVGFLADKTSAIVWVKRGFGIMLLGALLFASGIIKQEQNVLFFFSLIMLASGTYAIRALYFSLLKQGVIPLALTGTAVGLISLTGYTPDIFAGPIIGYFLDHYPGLIGHQIVFLFLSGFALIGFLATLRFSSRTNKPTTPKKIPSFLKEGKFDFIALPLPNLTPQRLPFL